MAKPDANTNGERTASPSAAPDLTPAISALWREILGLPRVGLDDNFFESGGTSLLATLLVSRINQLLAGKGLVALPIASFFEHPTLRALTAVIKGEAAEIPVSTPARENTNPASSAIAIIGMTGRFPSADSVEELWKNLSEGVESVTFFDRHELEPYEQLLADKSERYVAARPLLNHADKFDAGFFGIYPKEAATMDPQHRVFLECAWEVLERAGYDPAHTKDSVGVFAGCSMNTYFMRNLATGREFLEEFTGGYQVGNYVAMLGNDKDFLPTRVSYKLNLRGPSMSVQTACSTSLVAVAQAAQSLLTYGCDMALAGAVSITFPQHRGYVPQEGGLASLDGHCRPFDHQASGTVFGHGSAVLLLKRLDDALADGDQVLAVIKGFALNNDGSVKVGYTAPSVEGQAQVIARAQKMAGVSADSITYLEAHGTGTPLGDPIEVAALKKAFRVTTSETAFCSLGTAKANVGHLDVAAGATGLIKTVLQMQHRQIPGLLHFEQPNPHLGIEGSPFKIDRTLRPWEANGTPLRAGVSAFGVGGTNAHIVVEEAPGRRASDAGRDQHLLVWSAKTPGSLESLTASLVQHFHTDSTGIADAAYTLQTGRSSHALRRSVAVSSTEEAAALLAGSAAKEIASNDKPFENPGVIFCFPGQGVQTIGMGRRLYETEAVFRDALDRCSKILTPLLGADLLDVLYPAEATEASQTLLNQTLYAQPAIFSFEYALAQLWLSWGIQPEAMIGHSVGEYVAACIAGVFSLEDALRMIAARCRLMQALPAGSMLAVRRDEATVASLLPATLDIAAVNSPQLCVVSGPTNEIDAFIAKLDAEKIVSRKLATSHAFHSRMVDPALAPFAETVATVSFSEPKIPYVSTLTGKWATLAEISQPAYWTRQLRHAVRFADAITEILKTPERILLEVGPAETLVQLMRQIGGTAVLSSLGGLKSRDSDERAPEDRAILNSLGKLWTLGTEIDWQSFHSGYVRNRVLLPTYPFERQRHWIDAPAYQPSAQALPGTPSAATTAVPDTASTAEDFVMATVSSSDLMLSALKDMIADLSGTDLTGADADASFLELGFDSLFLTQLTQAIQGKYKLKLTFRQIMESYPTLDGLAKHLDEAVTPELKPAAAAPVATPAPTAVAVAAAPVAYAAPVVQPALTPVAAPVIHAPAGSLEALLASQVQALSGLFQQQMEFLRGQSFSAPVAAAAVQAAPVVAPMVAPAPAPVAAQAPVATAPAKEEAPKKPVFTPFKPLSRGETGGLNPTQEKYLKDFVASYNARTPGSKQFTQDNRAVFADGRVVSGFNAQYKEMVYPLVVERAKGAYLWDKDGNRYIDILNGYGAILYGHSPDFIVEAVHEQLDIGFPIGPQTPLVAECSRLVSELTGMERVTFCNTGSEAVMGAMRLARTVTGRNLIVMFSGDYHGSFDEVLVKSVGNQRSMPVAPGIPRESVANTLVLDYGSDEALEIIRNRADEIAAVLVEPVQSRHPELRPAEFLKEVRRITADSGSALIFDEVVTGFRTHSGGMQAVYGIRADLATYGKVVAGGLPVGILAGSPAFMDALDGGMWQYGDNSFPQVGVTFYAGTFMRHPLAMAAVKASLEHIKESGPSLQTDLAKKTSALVADLNAMFREFNYQSSIETFASWFFFSPAQEPQLARLLHYHLREQGIHIQEGFPCFLTTAHTDEDLQFVRKAFRTSLEKMQAGQAIGKAEAASIPAAEPAVAKTIAAPVVETVPIEHDIAITEPQREILIGTQLGDEANCAFNEGTSLRLKGDLNEAAFIASLEKLVTRHESLRSSVAEDGDTIHIDAEVRLPLEHDDLTALDAAARDARLKEIIAREASTPFDLYNGPLFRMRLVRLASDEHVLVTTAHHIIFDGWSTNVLFSELSALYNAAIAGSNAALPAPLTFTSYAAAQAEHQKTEENSEVETYWLNEFKTLPSPLELPTDRPRPAMRGNDGATRRFIFPAEFLKSVRKAGAKQGSTLFATLLAGYAQLIHRLSQQQDVVIGIPTAGQNLLENGGSLVGHCVNFLPIRSTFDPAQPIGQFVKQSRKKLLDAQDHQNYTYGTLLRKLKIQRESSRLPLVEVQFNVEQVGAGLKYEGLAADLSANPKTHVNMDLFFNFVDRGEELWLDVDYNTGLFDEATIARWCGHLQAILEAFVANAEQPIGQVSILNPAQTKQILVDWNRTATDFPRNSSIHQVFEEQVARTPNTTAVTFNGQSLTYAQLNEKANQLARFLRGAGIQTGDRVALCLDRSLEVSVSLLAILKVGASYVPVDASYPEQRIRFLVENSQAKALLTQASLVAKLPGLNTNVIDLDTDGPSIAVESGSNFPSAQLTGDAEAYVMYTSGSTGNPKGVRVPHRAVLRLVKNNSFASFAPSEVFLQLAPLSFDASTFEIWGALLNGGRLILAPAGRVTPEDIGTLIKMHNVTTLWLTAALFHLVATTHLEILRPLRQLLAGGDVLSVTHVRRILEELPHLRLINGYGPTENTTFTCCHTITPASLTIGSVPIGRPISNTRIYLVDASMQPVPVGVAGELLAAGDGVALGYLNAPELTSEKFIEHSFDGRSERLYRTGDLARYRPDGTVEFLGRADTQVKVRGYRIELAEIEYALERSPLVQSAVASVRTDWVTAHDAPGDKRLAAYIIPQKAGDNAALITELRTWLKGQLPDYMQPAAIVIVDSFPRTVNGKVDRRALPAPQPERMLHERAIVYPRTPQEDVLASIWSKVLNLKEVSVEDSIFELGGDSLMIFRINTLANQAGMKITARHIFEFKTIAAICAQVHEGRDDEMAENSSGTIRPVARSLHRKPRTVLQ
ncbi:amino acid adenylation domain-containing protein [Silvibacterium acidisoli]|uniref:amino acid adenylation domain-containing protein n=1 Tax=Acidobacteriaceae bacterium ZG23-2 TaxID=2883246 RepID=UPI00406D4A65